MSDNHVAPPSYTVTLTEQEFGLVLSALYEAPLPMKLTAPVANKLTTALAAAKGTAQAQKQATG